VREERRSDDEREREKREREREGERERESGRENRKVIQMMRRN